MPIEPPAERRPQARPPGTRDPPRAACARLGAAVAAARAAPLRSRRLRRALLARLLAARRRLAAPRHARRARRSRFSSRSSASSASRLPGRAEAMRRVELASDLPHRPARGLTDRISPVADDAAAQALWAAEQARLYASLTNLRAGAPHPEMAERDPNALPLRRAGAARRSPSRSAGANGRRGSARPSRRSAARTPAVAARIDAWIDPPAYTRQAPVFLSRRDRCADRRRSACRREASSPCASSRATPPSVTLATAGGTTRADADGGEPSAGESGRRHPQLRGGARPATRRSRSPTPRAPPPIRSTSSRTVRRRSRAGRSR